MEDPGHDRASPSTPPTLGWSLDPVGSSAVGLESIRLQAEEHPVIEDAPATSAAEHCLRLIHLKAYDEAAALAVDLDVLDVGCNTGYGTLRFLDVARRVVGVDVSERAIEVARSNASDGRLEFDVIDGRRLPFADDSFDLVVSFQVIEHIADPLPYVREIARVARPGGTVIFTTPNAAARLDPGMTPWNRFHVREYRALELDALLREVFSRVRIKGMFGTPTLYETEIGRVDRARQRIRNQEARERATTVSKPPRRAPRGRPLPVRATRAVVPARVRSWLRAARAGGAGVAVPVRADRVPVSAIAPSSAPPADAMPLETFLEFTLADLFYADTDLDRAMDFMAVCQLEDGAASR